MIIAKCGLLVAEFKRVAARFSTRIRNAELSMLAFLGLLFYPTVVHSQFAMRIPQIAAAGTLSQTAPSTANPHSSGATTQPSELSLPAMIVADEQVELHAKASGYISKIAVDYGSKVHRGDLLIELDIPELHDELAQAQATLNARQAKVQSLVAKSKQAELLIQTARAELDRYTAERDLAKITFARKSELYAGKAIPAQDFDVAQNAVTLTNAQVVVGQAKVAAAMGDLASAEADVKAAEAEAAVAAADVARAKTLLGYTRITAPFDGIVTRRNVDHGAFVRSAAQSAGVPLLTLAKVDRVRLVIDVPENSAPSVHVGTPVRIQLRALAGKTLSAAVSRTGLAISPETRTMKVEIDLDNGEGRFMPGMYARASLAEGPH